MNIENEIKVNKILKDNFYEEEYYKTYDEMKKDLLEFLDLYEKEDSNRQEIIKSVVQNWRSATKQIGVQDLAADEVNCVYISRLCKIKLHLVIGINKASELFYIN